MIQPVQYCSLTGHVLERAAKLVEQGHARHVFARNRHGEPVCPTCRTAVAFDAAGAIIRAAEEMVKDFHVKALVIEYAFLRLRRARKTLGLDGAMTVKDWNDHLDTTQAHVIGALEFAALNL